MGKPKCTEELIEQAVSCKRNGMTNKDICAYVGVNESSFYRWVGNPKTENQRKLCNSLKNAEADFKAALRSKVIRGADKDWRAAMTLLERMYPEEYGRPEARLGRPEAPGTAPTIVLGVEARPL